MSDNDNPYDASRIQVLEGLEAVRKRPGMYVGSTSQRGLHQIVFDVAERAVNEVLAGRASAVEVTLTSDGGVRVADDGPGVPVEAAGDTGGPGLEALLTRMHPGVAEPGGRHAVAMSLFGIGPCVTSALSSRLTAEVRRDGVRWVQEYARGVALAPPTSAGPTTKSGTTIAFWPDTDIFETTECSFAVLAERFRELAFLNRDLDISLTDERPRGRSRSVRYRFPGGARDFVAFLDAQERASVHPDTISFEHEFGHPQRGRHRRRRADGRDRRRRGAPGPASPGAAVRLRAELRRLTLVRPAGCAGGSCRGAPCGGGVEVMKGIERNRMEVHHPVIPEHQPQESNDAPHQSGLPRHGRAGHPPRLHPRRGRRDGHRFRPGQG
ncbi:hypothetical protein [Streptomyces sp. NBC_01205]|uniref:hypothetical protein n=1 Tax=Streptomyces sp. NBC_01205 TaxID=2903771 RepID=UPI002E0D8BCF